MKVYASKEEAEMAEGAFQGLDPHLYGDMTSAEYEYPDGHVFGYSVEGKVRVAWSDACECCGGPVEEGGDCEVCALPGLSGGA
jgi:hypothetical protein